MAVTIVTATIVLCVSLLIGYLYRTSVRKNRNIPPGPSGLPLFGNLFTLLFSKQQQHELIADWATQYGPIFSIKLLGTRICIINDSRVIQEAYQQNPNISDRAPFKVLSEELDNFNCGVSFAKGEVWKEQRRFYMNGITKSGNGQSGLRLEEIVESQAKRFVQMIAEHNGKSFNPFELTNLTIAGIVTRIVTGVWYGPNDERFLNLNKSFNRMFELMGPAGLISCVPALSAIPSPTTSKLRRLCRELLNFIDEAIESHKAGFDPASPTDDFIGRYLKAIAENSTKGKAVSSSFDETNLRSSCLDAFGPGWETATNAVLWLLFNLSQSLDTQRNIRKEIILVTEGCRPPSYDDRHLMPVTEAAIAESMRLRPVVPFNSPHIASVDCVIGGYDVPLGSQVVANLWYLGRSPKLWDKPAHFNPGRFLDEEGYFDRQQEPIPFGYGRRACAGENLARIELFLIITHVLQKFELRLSERTTKSNSGICGLAYKPEPFEVCAVAI